MPIRLRYNMDIGISSSSLEQKDLGNARFEAVTDGFGEGGTRKFTLAASATDVPLDLGNVATARFIAISTNAKDPTMDPVEITVVTNVITDKPMPVTPMDNTKQGHLMMSTSGLTALWATNPGTVDMEVVLFVGGD